MQNGHTKAQCLRGVRYRGTALVHSVNGIHPYPGMMVPTILESLLDEYAPRMRSILDPFCGTGRTLVAGRQRGMAVVGIDINPLATLIAGLRVNAPACRGIESLSERTTSRARRGGGREVRRRLAESAFDFRFWYPRRVIEMLANLLSAIEDVSAPRTKGRLFLLVCYSETARICSYTRESEHKLYRVGPKDRSSFRPDVLGVFARIARKNLNHLAEFNTKKKEDWSKGTADVICGEVGKVCDAGFGGRKFDALITSPPYGDARTTVAYGEFARLPLLWMLAMKRPPFNMHVKDVLALDRHSLGGCAHGSVSVQGCLARRVVGRIMTRNALRGRQVAAFINQLNGALKATCELVRPGGLIAFVVGRRVVAGLRIPLDDIIVEWSKELGVRIAAIMRREIPYKRLPRCVARRGIQGHGKVLTMLEEHVLIGRRR